MEYENKNKQKLFYEMLKQIRKIKRNFLKKVKAKEENTLTKGEEITEEIARVI